MAMGLRHARNAQSAGRDRYTRVAAGGASLQTRARWLIVGRRDAAAPAKFEAGGYLHSRFLRDVLAARDLHIRELLPGGAAFQLEHGRARTAVRGVPDGR